MRTILIIDTANIFKTALALVRPESEHDNDTILVFGNIVAQITRKIQADEVYYVIEGGSIAVPQPVQALIKYKGQRGPLSRKNTWIDPHIEKSVYQRLLKMIAQKWGYWGKEYIEGDTMVAWLVHHLSTENHVVILSRDKDFLQLLVRCSIYWPKIGLLTEKSKVVYTKLLKASSEFNPYAITLYRALVGDPSDNLPGIYGIGPAKATKLIQSLSEESIMGVFDGTIKPSEVLGFLSDKDKEYMDVIYPWIDLIHYESKIPPYYRHKNIEEMHYRMAKPAKDFVSLGDLLLWG
jgi:hypothetical protein